MRNVIYALLCIGYVAVAQVDRVQIEGQIITTDNTSITGVTVFNNTLLQGTVTNDAGVFYIDVASGDQLSFKAIQFESFDIVVTDQVIKERKLSINLNPDVKELEEVRVSNIDFMIPVKRVEYVDSGIEKVSKKNLRSKSVDLMEHTFSNKVRQPQDYEIRSEAFAQSQPRFSMFGYSNMVNMSRISDQLDVTNINKDDSVPIEKNALVLLKNKYEKEYLLDLLNLEPSDYVDFGYFVQENGLSIDLVQSVNELDLLEFLSNQAQAYKKLKKQ